MKFSAKRKINLANIDAGMWPFESEELSVEGADSPEEAQQALDRIVAERIGFYKGRANVARGSGVASPKPTLPSTPGFTGVQATPTVPTMTPPPAPATIQPPPAGVTSGPPADFQA